MNRIQSLFAGTARLLNVQADIEHEPLDHSQRKALLANFGAIVLNGLFFPTAGKILGAGLLLAWFLDELKSPLLLIGLLVPIQYGLALLAQPWIGQWLSGRPRSAPYYRGQALLRAGLWCGLALMTWLTGKSSPAWLITVFFFRRNRGRARCRAWQYCFQQCAREDHSKTNARARARRSRNVRRGCCRNGGRPD